MNQGNYDVELEPNPYMQTIFCIMIGMAVNMLLIFVGNLIFVIIENPEIGLNILAIAGFFALSYVVGRLIMWYFAPSEKE